MMKILFAAPDRDLLACYKELLEPDFGEVVTAFDGTQVLTLLSKETFDAAILDREVPRIDPQTIIARLREKQIPVILLINEPISVRLLTAEGLPNAYLSYPFDSEKLASVLRDTLEKRACNECLKVCGLEIDSSGFRIAGGASLTAGEIDILRALLKDQKVTALDGASISALNQKLSKSGSKAKIKYRTEKGFELVKEDE